MNSSKELRCSPNKKCRITVSTLAPSNSLFKQWTRVVGSANLNFRRNCPCRPVSSTERQVMGAVEAKMPLYFTKGIGDVHSPQECYMCQRLLDALLGHRLLSWGA
eukprot:1857314-Amphidinium_carterae.1